MIVFGISEYNQGQSVVPTGQYCVQITIERTVMIKNNLINFKMMSFLGVCQW
jgi:hypothetical protein